MSKIVGLDLDGILIGPPPLISKGVIEFLYKDQTSQELAYRLPCFFEQKVRQLSHLPFVRPPISNNCQLLKEMALTKKYQFYIISGRFGFLRKLTISWLKKHNILNIFSKIYLEQDKEQPHIFKEKILKKVRVDIFIDDDFDIICYLAPKFKNIRFYWYTEDKNTKLNISNITAIDDLSEILI